MITVYVPAGRLLIVLEPFIEFACWRVEPPEFCQTYVHGPLLVPFAVADAVPVAQLMFVTFTVGGVQQASVAKKVVTGSRLQANDVHEPDSPSPYVSIAMLRLVPFTH